MKCEECIAALTTIIDHLVNVERDIQERAPSTKRTIWWAYSAIEVAEECLPPGTAAYIKKQLEHIEELIDVQCWDTAYYYLNEVIIDYFRNEFKAPIRYIADMCKRGD